MEGLFNIIVFALWYFWLRRKDSQKVKAAVRNIRPEDGQQYLYRKSTEPGNYRPLSDEEIFAYEPDLENAERKRLAAAPTAFPENRRGADDYKSAVKRKWPSPLYDDDKPSFEDKYTNGTAFEDDDDLYTPGTIMYYATHHTTHKD